MVVTLALESVEIGRRQENSALPLICTVQAPHWPTPQPYLVPVIFRCSRSTHSSGVSGCAVTVWRLPLTVSVVAVICAMCPPIRPCSGAVRTF